MNELRSQDPQPGEEAADPVEAPQAETAEAAPADAGDSPFCPQCGVRMGAGDAFCGACGRSASATAGPAASGGRVVANPSGLNRLTALLLCLFLGVVGAHRFYAGKIGTALLFLVTIGGFFFVGVIYDCVMIATGEFTDSQGRKLHYWQ